MAEVEPMVATPIASQGITKVYAIQHAQIAGLLTDAAGAAPTYGEWFDVPGIKSLKISGSMETKSLRGDNRLIDSQSVLTGLTASFEHAKLSLIILQTMLGGSAPAADTLPYAGMGWQLPTSAFPKAFGLRAISAASDAPGGAVAFNMSRCSLSKFPEIGAAEEDYQTVSAELNINPPVGTGDWLGITIVDTYAAPAPWAPDSST
ncbi:MAG TPA: hypothetical protein VJW23_03490 [Propionibacteriaceae bacterium]|nr:hypothetical protein [Propionibacteriaceae bacterium]